MSRRIRTYKQYNNEAINYSENFTIEASKSGSSVSSVVWLSSDTNVIGISGESLSSNTATALLTANANNTGVVRIEVLATLANGEKKKALFDVSVTEEV